MILLGCIRIIFFAWWDGVYSLAQVIAYFTSEAADFALARMQAIVTKRRALTPEAKAYAERINRERAEVTDTLRKTVNRLSELDALYERILIAGQNPRSRWEKS